jgi:hypothetical protein
MRMARYPIAAGRPAVRDCRGFWKRIDKRLTVLTGVLIAGCQVTRAPNSEYSMPLKLSPEFETISTFNTMQGPGALQQDTLSGMYRLVVGTYDIEFPERPSDVSIAVAQGAGYNQLIVAKASTPSCPFEYLAFMISRPSFPNLHLGDCQHLVVFQEDGNELIAWYVEGTDPRVYVYSGGKMYGPMLMSALSTSFPSVISTLSRSFPSVMPSEVPPVAADNLSLPPSMANPTSPANGGETPPISRPDEPSTATPEPPNPLQVRPPVMPPPEDN